MQRGVNVIIKNGKGEILLTKREDFEIWCLPGGGINNEELAVDAAKREIKEEVGLIIGVIDLVGIYQRKEWLNGNDEILVFRANKIRGELKIDPNEVLEAKWFALEEVPKELIFGHKKRIEDFRNGLKGILRKSNLKWPLDKNLTRKELYRMRDKSGLSRSEFYLKYFNFE